MSGGFRMLSPRDFDHRWRRVVALGIDSFCSEECDIAAAATPDVEDAHPGAGKAEEHMVVVLHAGALVPLG
jgi:hypothetical protein